MVAANNAINNTVGASVSGVTNTLTVTNPSNTASSQALANITVGGGTAGDPFLTYTVSGVTNWSEGIDNSVSDNFVIAASTALGTTNVVSMTTAGAVSCVLGDFDVTRSSSGGSVIETVSNTSNTASSNARQQVTVAGTSAGDAFTTYTVSGTTNWSQGVDNSDSDAYVLSASTALGTTNVVRASTAGALNYPLQPACDAYLSGDSTNFTGDGTQAYVPLNAEIFDQSNSFNTSTNTFTCPVAGNYMVIGTISYGNLGVLHTTGQISIWKNNGVQRYVEMNVGAARSASNICTMAVHQIIPCAANDILNLAAFVSGSTKTVTLLGSYTFMDIYLVC